MELLAGIHQIDGVSSNAYLVVEASGLTVIDSGFPGSGPKILAYIQRLGHQPGAVRQILLTHQHPDHIGGAAALAQATGATVVAHRLDAPAIEGVAQRLGPTNAPLALLFRLLIAPRVRDVAVRQLVEDGDVLPVLAEEGGLRVVATPGHTPGQVSFYLPGRRLLFAGDAYMHRGGRILPPPTMFTADMPTAKRSMAALATLDIVASLPGHGAPALRDAGIRLDEAVKRG